MTERTYIRPLPLLGAPARSAERLPALPLAGREDLHFAAAELIERSAARTGRRVLTIDALDAEAAASPTLQRLIDRTCGPRAPIIGLSLDRPRIMGILNVTPDSFSDGGQFLGADAAIEHGLRLEAEGADILDIGGESTRPGAHPIDVKEESRRVLPVITALARRVRVPLSIDTRNAEVMRRAAAAGAQLVNDVSALAHDAGSLSTVAGLGLPVVLMHAQGDPRTMQLDPRYEDVVLDVYDALQARIEACEAAGIARTRIVVDPGIGFGKTLEHNLQLIGSLSLLHGLGCPVMLGASRKSFIGRLGGDLSASRVSGSVAAAVAGIAQGAQFVRVHDVAATRQALELWQSSMQFQPGRS
jgi:dihydropteroate synthase